ncbi:MAG: class I SAM-dependent methyltransferase [Terrimicrobiaceae bacterium]
MFFVHLPGPVHIDNNIPPHYGFQLEVLTYIVYFHQVLYIHHPRIHFFSQDLFSWEPNQTFGVVTSLAVIEHVPDIRGFLRKLRRFAKKGGRLVLMTLNECSTVYAVAKGLRRFDFKGPFERLYSRHHRHHFTLRSLRYLVEQTGLVVEEHFTHNFPLAAVDFPSRGPWLDATQKVGVAGLFSIGRIAQNAFLQTLVCRT